MYQELNALPLNNPKYLEIRHNLTIYKAILKKNIREAKMKYYHNLFEKYQSDMKNTWKSISEIFNKANRSRNSILKIIVNGRNVTSFYDMANEFNIFFANIGPLLASKLDNSNKKPFQFYLNSIIQSEFC